MTGDRIDQTAVAFYLLILIRLYEDLMAVVPISPSRGMESFASATRDDIY